jgi:hypothetical protein
MMRFVYSHDDDEWLVNNDVETGVTKDGDEEVNNPPTEWYLEKPDEFKDDDNFIANNQIRVTNNDTEEAGSITVSMEYNGNNHDGTFGVGNVDGMFFETPDGAKDRALGVVNTDDNGTETFPGNDGGNEEVETHTVNPEDPEKPDEKNFVDAFFSLIGEPERWEAVQWRRVGVITLNIAPAPIPDTSNGAGTGD